MQASIESVSVKVYIRFYNKKGYAIQIPQKITLQKIVQQIQLKSMIKAYNVILILKGKLLFDSSNPQSLNSIVTLQDKNIIHVLDKRQLNYTDPISINLQIIIKNQPNQKPKKHTFNLKSQSTINMIVTQILKVQPNLNANQITLLSAGRILQLNKKISNYYIQNQGQIICFISSTIHKTLHQIQQTDLKKLKNQEIPPIQLPKENIKNNQDLILKDQITANKQIQSIDQKKLQSQPKQVQNIIQQNQQNLKNKQQSSYQNQIHQSQNFIKFQKFPSLNINPAELAVKNLQNKQTEETKQKHKLQKKQKIQSLLAKQFQNQFYQPMLGDKSISQRYEDQPASPIEVTFPQYTRVNNLRPGDYLFIKGIADQQRRCNLDVYLHQFSGGNLNNLFKKHNANHVSKEANDYLVSWAFSSIKQKADQ